MNSLDIIVVCIMLFSILYFFFRGFLISVFNFCSLIISFFLTLFLYPLITKIIYLTKIPETIQLSVSKSLGLNEIVASGAKGLETDIINGLALPDSIKNTLHVNNNSEFYKSINVNAFEDYISSYVTQILITVISIVIAFVLCFVILKIVAVVLDLVSKLPVLNSVNKALGAIMGILIGAVFSWLTISVLVGFCGTNESFPVFKLLEESIIAKWFYSFDWIFKISKLLTISS